MSRRNRSLRLSQVANHRIADREFSRKYHFQQIPMLYFLNNFSIKNFPDEVFGCGLPLPHFRHDGAPRSEGFRNSRVNTRNSRPPAS